MIKLPTSGIRNPSEIRRPYLNVVTATCAEKATTIIVIAEWVMPRNTARLV